MSRIRKAYVDIPDGQVHYRHTVGDGAPLIFFHRNPASSLSFEPMMAQLTGERPLYAFDTPGFGGSFDPKADPSIEDYARWMLQAMDELGLDGVHVFAHHTGTHFAADMAAAHPHRFLSLCLNGIAYWSSEERETFMREYPGDPEPDPDGEYATVMWKAVASLFAEFHPYYTHVEYASAMRSRVGMQQASRAVLSQDFADSFGRISCPVLAMCAEDEMLRPWFDKALEARPDVESVILGPATFFSPELDTDRTVIALRGFMERVESKCST